MVEEGRQKLRVDMEALRTLFLVALMRGEYVSGDTEGADL